MNFLNGMNTYSSKEDLQGRKFGENDWRICFRSTGKEKKESLEIENPSRFCTSLRECNEKIRAGIRAW